MIFLPAIDLIDGKCVRLSQGDYKKKTLYSNDPAGIARSFQDHGAGYIHIVDLDAAKNTGRNNIDTIGKIIQSISIPVEVGGGIRSRDRAAMLFDIGVSRVILGTVIVKNSGAASEIVEEFGVKVAAGIDARDGYVRISGWAEGSGIKAVHLGKKVRDMGFSLVVYTDIARDGMLEGPNIEGIRTMATETGLPVIAAGGISNLHDIRAVKALEKDGVVGVISGKALYEGTLSVAEACRLLDSQRR